MRQERWGEKAEKLMVEARREGERQGHRLTAVWIGGFESKAIHCLDCGLVVKVIPGEATVEWTAQ